MALVASAAYFNFSLRPNPLVIPALMGVGLCGAAIGNLVSAISPHPLVTTVITNIALFFVTLFSPINFPIERLPEWLESLHQVLPIEPMAQLVRANLLGNPTSPFDWLHVAVWAVGSLVATAALSSRRG